MLLLWWELFAINSGTVWTSVTTQPAWSQSNDKNPQDRNFCNLNVIYLQFFFNSSYSNIWFLLYLPHHHLIQSYLFPSPPDATQCWAQKSSNKHNKYVPNATTSICLPPLPTGSCDPWSCHPFGCMHFHVTNVRGNSWTQAANHDTPH